MANSMQTAWFHFRAFSTHFRSRDVINAIFGITAITPLFFKLKKTKLILDVISNDLNHKNVTFFKKCVRKTSFKIVTIVTKMLRAYISVTVPDRPIVTIIHRKELIYSLSFHNMTCNLQ